jgi:hypothetical protein
VDDLRQAWRDFADRECRPYSALYGAIGHAVADDPELLGVVAAAPVSGQQPNVLLAAVHDLVLRGLAPELADVYAGRGEPHRAPGLYSEVCRSHQDEVRRLLASRHTQTNEPGRAALLALGLAVAAESIGEPIGLFDAGCSAGLNLLLDRYRFDFGAAGALGRADSPVTITCAPRGPLPVPKRLPAIAVRLGLDRSPVDLADADAARWLLACVWPDTGRLARTAAAVDLVRSDPPSLRAGDMVADLDSALDAFDPGVPVVVTTTSACGYLDAGQRQAFLATLARRSRRQRLAWVSAEEPGVVPGLPVPPVSGGDGSAATVLGLVTFDRGTPVPRALARCQVHGAWVEWAVAGREEATARSGS